MGGAVQEMGGGWGERVGARLERADFLGAAQAEQPLTLTLYVEASTVSAKRALSAACSEYSALKLSALPRFAPHGELYPLTRFVQISPSFAEQLPDPPHGERHLLGRLQDNAVAGRQSNWHRPPVLDATETERRGRKVRLNKNKDIFCNTLGHKSSRTTQAATHPVSTSLSDPINPSGTGITFHCSIQVRRTGIHTSKKQIPFFLPPSLSLSLCSHGHHDREVERLR